MYVLRAYQIMVANRPEDRYTKSHKNHQIFVVVSSIVSFALAAFFFAFVMCMFYDMYDAFVTGVPGIDAMQYKDDDLPRKQSCWTGLKDMAMANEPFGWRWFLPFPPKLPKRLPPPPASPPPTKEEEQQQQEILLPQSSTTSETIVHRVPEPEKITEQPSPQVQASPETLKED